ncbi:Transposable element Tcb2 transposase [Ceratobasidium sp. AG-Ba]|nr:Transposable element Tcb2 transposase [Ceratobasidium sp. AG-Ba]
MPSCHPQHTPKVRAQILALRETGLTFRLIAAKLGVPQSTVERTCSNIKKTRSYYSNRACSACPRKLRLADTKFAALSLSCNQLATAAQLRCNYFPHISTQTVRRRLRELGIKNYTRRRVPLLTKRHLKARRNWAQHHATWSDQD